MELVPVGQVFAYFAKVGVAGVELTSELKVGQKVRLLGATTDMETTVESLQIDRESVESAGPGQKVGLKVPDRARPGDRVYRVGGTQG